MSAPTETTATPSTTAPATGVARRTFRSMGTHVTVIAPSSHAGGGRLARAAEIVESVFTRQDERFSRFRPGTELSHVNGSAGVPTQVSPTFLRMVETSLRAARTTGGLFDPTILPALIDAGYDRDFDELIAGARDLLSPPRPCGRWGEIRVDPERGTVFLPEGVALDFGGIAKGWTVDVAAERIAPMFPWVIVDAGGDLRLMGETPDEGLEIAVEDPFDPERQVLRLRLREGAIATSSVTRRAWGPGLHHLIDPRTSLPADTGVLQATVWSSSCTEAEMGSKWALLAGPPSLERLAGVLVMENGEVVTNLVSDEAEADGGAA